MVEKPDLDLRTQFRKDSERMVSMTLNWKNPGNIMLGFRNYSIAVQRNILGK